MHMTSWVLRQLVIFRASTLLAVSKRFIYCNLAELLHPTPPERDVDSATLLSALDLDWLFGCLHGMSYALK